jgi:outer membrane immunogenic protein
MADRGANWVGFRKKEKRPMYRYAATAAAVLGLSLGFGAVATAGDPGTSWTGSYLGVEGGYGLSSSDSTVTVSPNDPVAAGLPSIGVNLPPSASFKDSGSFGGVTAGYNWQVGRSWLIGIETDFSDADITGSRTASSPRSAASINFPSGVVTTDSFSQKLDWFGTVRPRFGWLATDDLLLYGTGGFAYGRIEEQGSVETSPGIFSRTIPPSFSFVCFTNVPCLTGNSSRMAVGWTGGAGAEYRLPGTSASFKIEYLFVDLGTGDNVTLTSLASFVGSTPSSYNAAISQSEFHTVKAGFNWHF